MKMQVIGRIFELSPPIRGLDFEKAKNTRKSFLFSAGVPAFEYNTKRNRPRIEGAGGDYTLGAWRYRPAERIASRPASVVSGTGGESGVVDSSGRR